MSVINKMLHEMSFKYTQDSHTFTLRRTKRIIGTIINLQRSKY